MNFWKLEATSIFRKWKMTSIMKQMEEDLDYMGNGKQPKLKARGSIKTEYLKQLI